jgi:hypothetical protein
MQQTSVSVVSITTPIRHNLQAKIRQHNQLVTVTVRDHIRRDGADFNTIQFIDGAREEVLNSELIFK